MHAAIDPAAMLATVQPGLLNAELKAEAARYDPSSLEICSIGGNLSTNARNLCCVKYGVTTDYVHGVGSLKAQQLGSQLGDVGGQLTRAVKAALDPLGTMNPGKWV